MNHDGGIQDSLDCGKNEEKQDDETDPRIKDEPKNDHRHEDQDGEERLKDIHF